MRRLAAIVLLAALGGCSAFRASIGVGLGLGASVKAGPVDACGLGGAGVAFGNCYGITGSHFFGEIGLPGIARAELVGHEGDPERVGLSGPAALALLPALAPETRARYTRVLFPRPFSVEVSVYALIFMFHLGLDPEGLVRDVSHYFALAAGMEEDDPPAPNHALFPPKDELEDTPYRLVGREEAAAVDSGTEPERERARKKLVRTTLREERVLVEVEEKDFELWVAPRAALAELSFERGTREKLEALAGSEWEDAFAKAASARDPRAIDAVLEAFPLAPLGAQAPIERRRGELLLERGETTEALASFEDAVKHADTPEGRALVRSVPSDTQLPSRNAWRGSADLGGGDFLGASGRALWLQTPSGDVAWERSDALPEGFSESKVIGALEGVAILEAQAKDRPWLVGVDGDGEVRWKTPLPAAVACGSPMDQFYALGEGRLYVGRVDRILAIEAASGRIAWMSVRRDVEFEADSNDHFVPLDWRPEPGPPRRKPDGEKGFSIRLVGRTLEVTAGRGHPTNRFDAWTGRAVSGE